LFVKVSPTATSSLTVSHQDEYPAATLSFNLAPGVALSQATQAVQAARDKLGAPITLTGSCHGTAQAFQQSLSSEPILIGAALLAVYVILGVLYKRFIDPLTILSTLPSAGLGALLALIAVGQNLKVSCRITADYPHLPRDPGHPTVNSPLRSPVARQRKCQLIFI
jgi:HAE1 family hydrophobic/amphiphilic exporter-1